MNAVIKEIFDNSLESLGIEQARYFNLPYHLKKTNLSFDIYNTVSNYLGDVDFNDIDFSTKEIYDFSEEEIEIHAKVLSASMALSCLGNSYYVKLLVHYLDFPESRWTFRINFLLKKLFSDHDFEMSIPSKKDILDTQYSFVRKYFYTDIKNFANDLLWHNRPTKYYYMYGAGATIADCSFDDRRLVFKDFIKPSIDEIKCAEYFYFNASKFLAEEKYDDFVAWLDRSITKQSAIFVDTISASICDVFNDFKIYHRIDFWIGQLKKQTVSPLTSVVFYKIISTNHSERELASKFIFEFIGKNLKPDQEDFLTNIFQCKYHSHHLHKIGSLINSIEAFPDSTRINLEKIAPIFSYCIGKHISNLYLSEIQSLTLIDQKKKYGRDQLLSGFTDQFEQNNQLLIVLTSLESRWTEMEEMSRKISVLLTMREEFSNTFLYGEHVLPKSLKDYYRRLFKVWTDETFQIDPEP